MSKINIMIDIELDTKDAEVPSLLAALSSAFGGAQVNVKPITTTPEPKTEEPVKEEAPEEPKAKKPVAKKPVAKEPAAEEPVAEEPKVEEPAKPKEPTLTVDEVRNITAEAKRAGKSTAAIRDILKKHGAAIVSDLKPEAYASFVADIKAL